MKRKKKVLTELQQNIAYKMFLQELKKLKIEENFPDIDCEYFSDYNLDLKIAYVDYDIKVLTCKHEKTRLEVFHDSHHTYEEKVCLNCGTTLDRKRI